MKTITVYPPVEVFEDPLLCGDENYKCDHIVYDDFMMCNTCDFFPVQKLELNDSKIYEKSQKCKYEYQRQMIKLTNS